MTGRGAGSSGAAESRRARGTRGRAGLGPRVVAACVYRAGGLVAGPGTLHGRGGHRGAAGALRARRPRGVRAALPADRRETLRCRLRILGNRSDAEEAVQEAFVKIWHSAGRFQAGRGSAQGWMVSIARNQSIDLLRARNAPTRDIADMVDLADPGPTPEASAPGPTTGGGSRPASARWRPTGRRRCGRPMSRAGAMTSWPAASRCRSTPCGPGCAGR